MNDINDDIAAAEAEWAAPNVTREESPETAMAVKAHGCFVDKIMLASSIKKRRAELGLEGELVREKLDGIRTINGMCRKANGDIDRVAKSLNEDALKWQRAVNKRKGELKDEIADIQRPMVAFIEKCEAEDADAERLKVEAELQAKRAAEEAERKAAQAIEDARRAAEAEANRKEAERLAAERAILAAERAKEEAARREHNAKVAAEQKAIQDEQRKEREKLAEERREFEAAQRAAAKIESDRLAKIAADKRAEEAELQRVELAKAEAFQREQAAEKERLRLEAIEPDLPKLRRFAAAIKLTAEKAPKLTSAEAQELSTWAVEHLTRIAAALLDFGTQPKGQ